MMKFKMVLSLCCLLVLVGCEEKMRKHEMVKFEYLNGIVSLPNNGTTKLIILLHGIGANEKDLLELGEIVAPNSIVVSLQAPIALGSDSYSWFNVEFTPNGPQHNSNEAEKIFQVLEKEILSISKRYNIALANIDIMGFSQGSIMTMGLVLRSHLQLGHYLCFSGRTLPEFAAFAAEFPDTGKKRKVFLAHGLYDDRLPVNLGRTSKEILLKVKADLSYHEFPGGHTISPEIIEEAKKWLIEKKN